MISRHIVSAERIRSELENIEEVVFIDFLAGLADAD